MKNLFLSLAACAVVAGLGLVLFSDRLLPNGTTPAAEPQTGSAGTDICTTAADTGLTAAVWQETAADTVLTTPAWSETAWAETTLPAGEMTVPVLTETTVCAETTAAAPAETTTAAAVPAVTEPAGTWGTLAEKYSALGLTLNENELLTLDACFAAEVQRYEALYKPLHAENGSNVPVSVTAAAAARLDALANVSPAAFVLNSHRNAIRCNPVLLLKKLSRDTFTGEEKAVKYTGSLTGTAPVPVAYTGSPVDFIRSVLLANLGDGDYYIGYSESDKLYYVYLLDAGNDLCASALYFKFENGVLTAAGADCAVRSGSEVVRAYANCGGEMAGVGAGENETVYFANLSACLHALIGSAPEALLPENPSVSCETSVCRDYADNGSAAVKGIYNSCWFALR